MADDDVNIKAVQLYNNVDKIYNDLEQLGYSRDDPLKVEDVCKFDQFHYYGVKADQEAIDQLGITSTSRLLDIGAGLGGPARYIAHKTKCKITTIELQEDLNEINKDLSRRCGLADHVTCVHGDFMKIDLEELGQFDAAISIMALLHIPDKKTLFDNCHKSLKPGGKMYIEDFFMKNPFTRVERESLKTDCYIEDLASKEDYVRQLKESGFDTEFQDCTDACIEFVTVRLEEYRASKDHHIRVHGERLYKEQEAFYDLSYQLFRDGNLGGCKIIATKSPA